MSGNIPTGNYLSIKQWRSLRRSAQAFEFLSQDINEEMTHTCKERKEKKGKKERGSEGCRFQGDEGW